MRALLIPKSAPYDICRYLVYFSGRKLHYPVGPNASQTTKLWEMTDVVAMIEAEEAKVSKKRGSYKKKA